MKICPNCQQTYTDEGLNFCLNDGGILVQSVAQKPPPTIMLDKARPTNPNVNNDFTQPISNWQQGQSPMQSPPPFQPAVQNPNYMSPTFTAGGDQNLPIIALILGSGAVLFSFCCGLLSFPLAIGAVVTGFMGMNNANNDSQKYTGKNLAIGGMALGGISLLISIGIVLISFVFR